MTSPEQLMDPRIANAVVLAMMALKDGRLDDTEHALLGEMVARVDGGSVEQVLAAAEGASLADVAAHMDNYADRFFIAMRAYVMAHADDDFHDSEQAFFDELTQHFALEPTDIEIIRSTSHEKGDETLDKFHARIVELYEASTFYHLEI